jgi:hypothetical protein
MKIGGGYRPDLLSIVVRAGVLGVSPVIGGGAPIGAEGEGLGRDL